MLTVHSSKQSFKIAIESNQKRQCKNDGPVLTCKGVREKSINVIYFYKISLDFVSLGPNNSNILKLFWIPKQ